MPQPCPVSTTVVTRSSSVVASAAHWGWEYW